MDNRTKEAIRLIDLKIEQLRNRIEALDKANMNVDRDMYRLGGYQDARAIIYEQF